MTKAYKGFLILLTPFVIGFISGILVGHSCSKDAPVSGTPVVVEATPSEPVIPDEAAVVLEEESPEDDVDGTGKFEAKEIIYYGPRMAYAKVFADLNDAHVSLAKQVGLTSIPQTKAEVAGISGLVKVVDNDYYVVDDLRYSMPFLTKGASEELMTISKAFSDSLKSKNLLDYKLIVSSLLRTEEDVKRLRRSGNPNASDNSAHCYGTTFDITYTRYYREQETESFMQPYELTKVLGEVLRDRKKAGACLIKYERKEHCFHITSCK